MKNSPLFSIIIPHYQPSVTEEEFRRCMKSLEDQTDKDFEVLLYHDGPLTDPDAVKDSPYPVQATKKRIGDFGHSLRDFGIRQAKGEWIIHLNADGVLYPNAIETLKEHIRFWEEEFKVKPGTPSDLYFTAPGGGEFPPHKTSWIKKPNIIVFAILLRGRFGFGQVLLESTGSQAKNRLFYSEDPASKKVSHLSTGYPVAPCNIDCMQLVMRRDLWLKEGGWHNKSRNADSEMYPEFALKYGASFVPQILGEHYP